MRGPASTRGWVRITEIRKPSQLVFLFDGLLGLNYSASNANRINARHERQSVTNVAFFDGHVAWLRKDEIYRIENGQIVQNEQLWKVMD